MLATLRKRMDREDEGFTLIELMVVVLIIAILLAIAIPTFLGAQDRARDRGAQSNLRNGITAAKTIATDDEGQFTGVNVTELDLTEGSLTWVGAGDPAVGEVALVVQNATEVVLVAESASGKFFCMSASSTGDVGYGEGDAYADVDTLAECQGSEF